MAEKLDCDPAEAPQGRVNGVGSWINLFGVLRVCQEGKILLDAGGSHL
jgi:hypothetical protein